MDEKELKELFAEMEEQGWKPMLCDTPVPLYEGKVPCGIPTMCGTEYISEMMAMPRGSMSVGSVFMVHVSGDSMTGAGINAGDMVHIETDVTAYDGDIVLACIDGEITLKTYYEDEDGVHWLLPHNEDYEPIRLSGENNVRIMGRVKLIIKNSPRVSARQCKKILSKARQKSLGLVPPSPEVVRQAIREVSAMIEIGRLWFAVYRALVDALVVSLEDYEGFIDMVVSVVPEHKKLPKEKELQRLAVGSFTKSVDDWQERTAPVTGKRYRDYLNIANRMKTLLGRE